MYGRMGRKSPVVLPTSGPHHQNRGSTEEYDSVLYECSADTRALCEYRTVGYRYSYRYYASPSLKS